MAEEIKVILTADVSQGISNIGKFNAKLGDTDDIVSGVIGSSKNLDDALDKLGKQGLLSINSLSQSIGDFKEAFSNATDPAEIKKFGDAITVLQKRQQDLINSGLGIEKSHGSQTVATQRLSASVLGLSNHLGALPPELAGLTHGFDQIIESFERITHGTESAGDKVSKFAGVLGQVGLGLAISVAVSLLVDFVKGLLDSDAALEKATEEGARFADQIDKINGIIEDSKANLKFIKELGDINIDVNFGKGFTTDLLKGQAGFVDLQEQAVKFQEAIDLARKTADEAFKSFQDGISDDARAITSAFSSISKVPEGLLKGLSEADKKLIENVKNTSDALVKAQKELSDNTDAQTIQAARIRQTRSDEEREQAKKSTDALKGLFESRAAIIKEFTAKFASIKDPFPDFFTKNLPLGKVEDKALRAALENAFKVLETASRDLFNTKKIDPGTIPIEIKFKPEIAGPSDLVRAIEDKFGEIGKQIEDGVNKGIINVPVDFKIAPEGDGKALEELNKRIDDFLKQVQSLTGQKNPRLDISPDFLVTLNEAKKNKVLDDIEHQLNISASNVPVKIVGKADVKIIVDQQKVAEELSKQLNDAIQTAVNGVFVGIGEGIGDAISKGLNSDSFKGVLTSITDLLATVGKALVAAGVKMLGLQKAIDALRLNPAVSIAFGIALIALSKALANNIQGAREKGGPVQGGFSYLVNEKGKEIFQPNSGSPYWIDGGPQIFKPKTSGKIISASFAKMFADKFNLPKFADGGLVSGPVFGLLGEGSLISSINPEVIAPLETLKNLLPGFNGQSVDVRVSGQIRNRVIALGQNREARSNRRTG